MRGIASGASIDVPEGWRVENMFGRLVTEGMCTYEYLASGRCGFDDVFRMMRMLDFRDYISIKRRELIRKWE